jgi:hypothetical protein
MHACLCGGSSWPVHPDLVPVLQGFEPSWSSNNTVLTCVPAAPIPGPSWAVALIVATCVSGAMLLCAVGLLVWLRMTVQLRPRWQREKELAEARRRGMPAGGPATIVVTDIEGCVLYA